MSDAGLSDRDRQVLQVVDDEVSDAENADDFEEIIERLKEKVRDQGEELVALKTELRNVTNVLHNRIDGVEEQLDVDESDDVPPIVRKKRLSQEERKENLSTSEYLAVLLHENWDEIKWKMGSTGKDIHGQKLENKEGVDTRTKANAKYNPSQLKYRLKQHANQDLHSMQVYRALKTLARQSGGNEVTRTEDGRVDIIGGMYEYREKATPDGKDVRRVVWREDNE